MNFYNWIAIRNFIRENKYFTYEYILYNARITIDLRFHLLPAWYVTIDQTKYEIIIETQQPSLKKSNNHFYFSTRWDKLGSDTISLLSIPWLGLIVRQRWKEARLPFAVVCKIRTSKERKPCNDTRALSAARWSRDDNSPARRSVSLIIDTRSYNIKYGRKIWTPRGRSTVRTRWGGEERNCPLSAIPSDSFHLSRYKTVV